MFYRIEMVYYSILGVQIEISHSDHELKGRSNHLNVQIKHMLYME